MKKAVILVGFLLFVLICSGCNSPVVSPVAGTGIQYSWRQLGLSSDKALVALACSGDGNIILAAANQGGVYRSADAGLSWTPVTALGGRVWSAVSLSADGTKALACSAEYTSSMGSRIGQSVLAYSGQLFSSADGGATWIGHTELGGQAWQSLAMSSDGSIQFAACQPTGLSGNDITSTSESRLYKSVDGGITWFKLGQDGGVGISSSPDGSKVFVAVIGHYGDRVTANIGGSLRLSTDGGAVFRAVGSFPSANWAAALISSDGQKLMAADSGSLFRSVDGGASWSTQLTTSSGLIAGDSSLNFILNSNGTMYSSCDNGTGWAKETSAGQHSFTKVIMTPDGRRAYATATDNGVPILFRADR